MKKRFLALFRRLRPHRHVVSINDLEASAPNTDPARIVSAPCRKCGVVLKASHGLAFDCTWTQEPKLVQEPLH
jgi:hypothetical protein